MQDNGKESPVSFPVDPLLAAAHEKHLKKLTRTKTERELATSGSSPPARQAYGNVHVAAALHASIASPGSQKAIGQFPSPAVSPMGPVKTPNLGICPPAPPAAVLPATPLDNAFIDYFKALTRLHLRSLDPLQAVESGARALSSIKPALSPNCHPLVTVAALRALRFLCRQTWIRDQLRTEATSALSIIYSFLFMHVLESGAALSPALPCVCLLRNMAISECDALTEAGCMRTMAQMLQRAYTVQCVTPDITHHPIVQQACGVVRALCYNHSSNQTRARLAGVIKCLVKFLCMDHQLDLLAEAAGALHEACAGCQENAAIAGDEAAVAKLVRAAQHVQATPMLVLETMSCLYAIMFVNKHVRDGAVAMGDIPALLSHLRALWHEGYDESAAIIGVCKAVEMIASGILVSLREAGAIAEGLDIRARARTPMIQATHDDLHRDEQEHDYAGFQSAAELVAERQQMEYMGLSEDRQHDAYGSPAARTSSSFVNGNSSPVGIVRRCAPSSPTRTL